MKCIHCQKDTDYKTRERNGGHCQACSHPFAFEPKTDRPKVTDQLFQRVIEDVSGRGPSRPRRRAYLVRG